MFSKSIHITSMIISCDHFLLFAHCRLETLILTSNNIDSVACFTICAGVIENRGLKKVVLDGNPIGEQVSSVLASLFCGRHCALHWKNSYYFFYLQIIIVFFILSFFVHRE